MLVMSPKPSPENDHKRVAVRGGEGELNRHFIGNTLIGGYRYNFAEGGASRYDFGRLVALITLLVDRITSDFPNGQPTPP
jgi:hypothetical protein